ncbi:hypothetical protein AMJ39_09685 [candidate division TA06 bacterium DG_24]|uniref:Permease n=1 Tax=candidate division TA06 bacterium DG_24 TaxID=1703770 RepID=A0A0S7WPK9_UNCT6|nr:MAG: hypothetical protein AMJ39_09685 [candidate division TA06 bacterium DG_24]
MFVQAWTILRLILVESYAVVYEAGIFILFGFLLAGIIHVFLRPDAITRHLGTGSTRSVLWASILGVPLPLCSCSVMPVAASLKRKGASDGAVTSFLISTPESGVDSIAISWALLDPIMTVFRPVAALLTAVVAGVVQNIAGRDWEEGRHVRPEESVDAGCGTSGCCEEAAGVESTACTKRAEDQLAPQREASRGLYGRLRDGLGYILHDLFPSLDKYFFWGFLATGIIAAVIPDGFFHSLPGNSLWQMPIMLIVGVPLYICATASTPIAAALILKGITPGVALIFLLAGPATNLATMAVVYKMMRRRGLIIYLVVIALSAVLLGLLLDWIYGALDIDIRATLRAHREPIPAAIQHGAAIVFLVWLAYSLSRRLRLQRIRRGRAARQLQ